MYELIKITLLVELVLGITWGSSESYYQSPPLSYDDSFLNFTRQNRTPRHATVVCPQDEYLCDATVCKPASSRCNGQKDCSDGSDEEGCVSCTPDVFHCDFTRCVRKDRLCDGHADCIDGADERNCRPVCSQNQYFCDATKCIPASSRCNGLGDCSDGTDENGCASCTSDAFHCDGTKCIRKDRVCDRNVDCIDGSDELYCTEYTICHRSDPQVAQCIRNAVEVLKPKLNKGIPELGVAGIEPFFVDKIVLFDGIARPNLNIYLENIYVTGCADFEITRLDVDVEQMTYRFGVKFHTVTFKSEYDINAWGIRQHGPFYADATNMEGNVVVQGMKKYGKFRFSSADLKVTTIDIYMHLDNLFRGNKPIAKFANDRLKPTVIKVITPIFEREFSKMCLKLSNRITQHMDYDKVFPL